MRSILYSRVILVFILSAYDSANHQDFHEMYIIDGGNLSSSMIQQGLHSSRNRAVSNISSNKSDAFKIKILDQIINKPDPLTEIETQFFIVEVFSDRKRVAKVEKSYPDFKAFEVELEYGLRGMGIEAPKLEEGVMDKLMPSTDSMFK